MEIFVQKLIGFVLILTRLSAFFMLLPIFGSESIPVRIKIAAVLILSIFFSFTVALPFEPAQVSNVQAALLIANESIYGLALGLIAAIVFSSVRLAGQIIEQQMGLSFSQILDPITGENADPLSVFLEMLFILLFLAADGHHLFLQAASRSFQVFPLGSVPSIAVLLGGVAKAGSIMFVCALRLSAPILAALLMMVVLMAILARIVPEINIFFFSLPITVGCGLLLAAIFVPFIGTFVSEFAGWMGKLMPL